MNFKMILTVILGAILLLGGLYWSLFNEKQNKAQRYIQNIVGLNGTLEVYAGEKLVKRFLNIKKLSTAIATESETSRPYRYGYGVNDVNFNNIVDDNEKKVYFEFSDYSSNYIFFNNK